MTELRAINISIVLMALVLGIFGNLQGPGGSPGEGPAPLSTAIIGLTTPATPPATSTVPTSPPTSLERAHWCRTTNGTYLPYGYIYMQNVCTMCECTPVRLIRCATLQCMPTYCIDNTMPYRRDGQCCTTCGYEVPQNSCVYEGISYPHGTIITSIEGSMQCWCELGNIECRNYQGSLGSTDLWNDTTAIIIIIVVVAIVVVFGLLMCCGCTLFYYYYYQRYEQSAQQAYDQYINSAGWQPVEDEEQNGTDASAEEKRIEAEKYQFSDSSEVVPPPYAAYHNTLMSGNEEKEQ